MIRRLSESDHEGEALLHLVVPVPDEVAPLRTALSLTLGEHTGLRAWSLRRAGDDLPAELRIARFGLSAQRDADRAVGHLVSAAVRGAHTPIRPWEAPEDRPTPLRGATLHTHLLVAWTRQGPLPEADRLSPVVEAHPGPITLLIDDRGPSTREVLGLAMGSTEHPAVRATGELLRALERGHPTWRVVADGPSRAERALRDAHARTLILVPVGEQVPAGLLSSPGDLEDRVPGRLGLVFAPEPGRAERLLEILAAVSARRAARAAS
jgi:hypothetical protein